MTEREREAVEEALRYLNMDPPRISLAVSALKAALAPEKPRWSDDVPIGAT